MSVPEIIKAALPLSGTQSESSLMNSGGANGTPIKSNNASGTPLRSRNSQAAPAATPNASSNDNSVQKGKSLPKPPEEFFKDLQQFHEKRATPCTNLPKISGKVINLHELYSLVTERGGFAKVNNRDEWDDVLPSLGFKDKCVNASAAIKHIYRRYLEKYERLNFFGEDPDKVDAADVSDSNDGGRSRRFFSSVLYGGVNSVNTVPMSYNYRQHIVNMDRRRTYKMSLDLHKPSPYEKLMLSLISPLPNEQDFAINVCTLMANESKHTLKLNEYPKLLDALLSHAGVFPDLSMRELFQHVYKEVRHHSLFGFWRDLLHKKPQILELYSSETVQRDPSIPVDAVDTDVEVIKSKSEWDEYFEMDFLNLGRGKGTQDYVGQRVQQILSILRNLSFFDENMPVFAKNRTFLRFIVMSANIRWGNIHNQALDIAGNVATELELLDPTSDGLSRSLMATLCDGIEGMDRAVIINSLEIMYKLCQRESNEDYINKCLNLKFYQTICLFLSLNDIMLLIYTLEAIYALTSMGTRSCHLIMQVRGVVDQLVSLITVEAQSYGPDGCILMRVVETVPGNMLPMVAQNIANLQNVAVIQNKQNFNQNVATQQQHDHQEQLAIVEPPVVTVQPIAVQSNVTASHDDEQYALSWLGATFERACSQDSRVEQQELYRMYLSHCQKSGKHSVVTHTQFPRLVRLIFNVNVGPTVVKRSDGTDLPGLYYVAIRLRAQPLPIQSKSTQVQQKGLDVKLCKDTVGSARKLKKKIKLQTELPQQIITSTAVIAKQESNETASTIICKTQFQNSDIVPKSSNATSVLAEDTKSNATVEIDTTNVSSNNTTISETPIETTSNLVEDVSMTSQGTPTVATPAEPFVSTFQAIAPVTASGAVATTNAPTTAPQPSSSLIKSLLANKVTQRQQKQKEMVATAAAQPAPLKIASSSISALVNNPLMQNTPLKVGQTTIKPLNAQTNIDKKHIIESTPPPLAPLSGGNTTTVTKDNTGRPVIIANQMLVDILDKKTTDPPHTSTGLKRKGDEQSSIAGGRDTVKRLVVDAGKKNEPQVTPSKNAANLYAEMAASILEDEDLEDIPPPMAPMIKTQEHQSQPLMIPATIQNVQRQLLFQSNQTQHLKINQKPQQHTAMATIKTDQGLQTVPVILQQKQMDPQQPQQQLIQQVIQAQGQVSMPQPQQQTQYVLATNPQGQTYLVAQQSQSHTPPPQQPTQTVLVTQTPQQQSAGTKTIIILQQQTVPSQSQQQQMMTPSPGGGQKMIMTTAQGQQVLLTQRQAATITSQPQQQIFINPQTGAATHIQHVPVSSVSTNMQQTSANMLQRQLIQTNTCNNVQQQTGQISPSLLSQLNHIPATIKLHNPNIQMTSSGMQSHQQQQQQLGSAALSRLGKSVSIVQTGPGLTGNPIQIPQLQQHQSIIQQHIISGPSEKRQVIVGGRTIEIKETVITQAQPQQQQQQCQLNSQTIITTQQPQQQQHQMIAIPQHQQHQASSIIHQKMSVPMQQTQQHQQTSSSINTKACVKYSPQSQQATQMTLQAPAQATVSTSSPIPIKKHQLLTHPKPQLQQNTPTQNVASATIRTPFIGSRPTTPISVATNIDVNTTIVSAMPLQQQQQQHQQQQHQQQQQQDQLKSNSEAKTVDLPSKPTLTTSNSTVTTTTHAAIQPFIDPNWIFICDWRNCPRRKYKSIQDLHHHACLSHCPDHLEAGAEIFCQWGPGPGLCDGIPRKRFSLMTHILDRHLTLESLRNAVQRRIQSGSINTIQQPAQSPVTIVRNLDASQRGSTASPALSTSSSSSLPSTGSSAIHAIKRHTADFVNPKELMDENEGPVTKSIRLTASLILRNLVTYTTTAKRSLRRHEAHLANVALSNVESSATISHILFEINN